jgi:hypothetical protein
MGDEVKRIAVRPYTAFAEQCGPVKPLGIQADKFADILRAIARPTHLGAIVIVPIPRRGSATYTIVRSHTNLGQFSAAIFVSD